MILGCFISVNILLKLPRLYVRRLLYLTEGVSVNSNIREVGLGIAVVVAVMFSACLVAPETEGNKPPVISSIEAEYINVYPQGASEIRSVVLDPESDAVQLKWSSNGGTLMGDGPTLVWQAPNDYGDYNIMGVAKDG